MRMHMIAVLAVISLMLTACGQESQPIQQQVVTPPVVTPEGDNTPAGTDPPQEGENPAEVEGPTPEGNEPTGAAVKEIRVEMFDFGFNVTGDEIKKGDRVKLTVVNTDGKHGFSMPSLGVDLKPEAGGEASTEFVADKAGEFDFRCNVPCGTGHRQMTGSLVVEE